MSSCSNAVVLPTRAAVAKTRKRFGELRNCACTGLGLKASDTLDCRWGESVGFDRDFETGLTADRGCFESVDFGCFGNCFSSDFEKLGRISILPLGFAGRIAFE